ncbi:MAG: hypothetical protein Kow0090_10870 [Myxococcota bacterium]
MFRRFVFKLPVPVLDDGGDSDGALIGYAKNISAGGVFVKTTSPSSPGRVIKMRLDVPGSGISVRCTGEVVWNRQKDPYSPYDSGMGIKFLDLDEKLKAAIDNYVREHLR